MFLILQRRQGSSNGVLPLRKLFDFICPAFMMSVKGGFRADTTIFVGKQGKCVLLLDVLLLTLADAVGEPL